MDVSDLQKQKILINIASTTTFISNVLMGGFKDLSSGKHKPT